MTEREGTAPAGATGTDDESPAQARNAGLDATSLRAAVLGANDGVVSNASLIMGVAGAVAGGGLAEETVVVSGMAGLLAGAFSMAMGEWISVRSATEAAQAGMIDGGDDQVGASPWRAAFTSFVLFAVGALLPLVPFLFTGGATAVGESIALSLAALFGLGAAISRYTHRSAWYSGLRQAFIGALATAITYGVGAAIGVSVAG